MRRTHGFAVAGCAAAAILLTACGGSGSGDDASTTSAAAGRELIETLPPGRGEVERVRWALPAGEPTTLDPMRAGAESESAVVANLCEHVLSVRPDFSVGPGLAERAEWADRRTFVIDLRSDVRFWSGRPMTADDVVWSLRRAADPRSQSIYAGLYMFVSAIERTGPDQVTIRFRAPDAQFRNALAGPAGTVVERAYAERAGRAFGSAAGGLSCTGPFQLAGWTPGEKIELTRFEDHRDGAPQVGTLEFRFLTDSSTLTSALLAGEIDGTYDAPVTSASALASSAEGELFVGPSTRSISFGPTTPEGPAADPRVRAALDLAIDKQAFVSTVLRGYGETAKTFTAPLSWSGLEGREIYRAGYDRLAEPIADLEEAKRLIAEARPERRTLIFAVPAGDALMAQTATIVQAAAKSIGLDAEIRQLQATEFSSLFYDPSRRAGIDFVVSPAYSEVPGALYYAPQFVLRGGLFNWSGYENPEVTRDILAAQASIDPDETARLFTRAQAIYAPDRLQVTLGLSHQRLFLNRRLTGAIVSIAYISSPWAARLGAAEGQ
jgi:peptide/nickel transport system substrate-binding protein